MVNWYLDNKYNFCSNFINEKKHCLEIVSYKTTHFLFYKYQFPEQYSQCIWDKDTDEMIWYPDEIDECTRKYNIKKLCTYIVIVNLLPS